MEYIRVFLWLSAITYIGWNIAHLLLFRKQALSLVEKWSISYGLGLACVSMEMLLFYFFKMKYTVPAILLAWLPLCLVNALRYFKNGSPPRAERYATIESGRRRVLAAFLMCGIAFEAAYVFFRALIKPMESYDAIAIYAIKAKIFYFARSIPADYFHSLAQAFPHPDYPLNIPLAETLGYLFMGSLNDQLVKVLFPLFFIAILGALYFAIRRFASRTYSLLFTFLLASIPQFSAYGTNGYLDLPLAYYVFSSALFLFWWFEDTKKVRHLVLSALMAGMAAWTKNEGLMYCAVSILAIMIFFVFERNGALVRAVRPSLLYGGVALIVVLPWQLIKTSAHLANSDVALAAASPLGIARQLYKIGPIIYEFQKQFFGPKKWNILWLVILFVSVSNYRKVFEWTQKYVSVFLLLALSGYLFFYIVSHVEIHYFLSRTWSRFLIHFLPIAVYWLARMLKEDVPL